jgi:serine/threonine protein kinase
MRAVDLDREQWQAMKGVIEQALEVSGPRRQALLDRELHGDPDLLACAREMLDRYDTATRRFGLLDSADPTEPRNHPGSHAVAHEPGRIVGHYRLLRKLGEGGMGVVYLAEDERLGRQVALKFLVSIGPESIADAKAQLLAESRAAAVLNHPAIVTLHDVVDAGDELVTVMEHVEGRPLSELIADPLPLGFALRLSVQLADALGYAHGRGIIHCDLKPANIHVLPNGSPKILDFGLARALAGSGHPTDTQQGQFFGTPGYLAPERLLGRQPSAASDVYALGVIMYRLITGEAPFPTDDQGQLFLDTLSTLPKPPSEIVPGIPLGVDELIMRCLAKTPRDRLQPHEVARALSNALMELDTSPLISRLPPAGSETGSVDQLQASALPERQSRLAAGVRVGAAVFAFLTLMGFISSISFNQPVGRVGDFAVESALLWPWWGLRAGVVVIGASLIFSLALLVIFALCQMLKPVLHVVPGSSGIERALGRLSDAPVAILASVLLVAQLAVLAWMRWRFSATWTGLDSFITGEYQALKYLGPRYGGEHTLLSYVLTVEAFVFGASWFWLLRREPRRGDARGRAYAWAGVGVTALSILLFQAVPFRILYHAEAERVTFGAEHCYLMGRYREDALLFCPHGNPPWTLIVRAADPTLRQEGTFESIFSRVE